MPRNPLHTLTIGDIPREQRRTYPGQSATVDGELRLTWEAFDDRVNCMANALAASGFGDGDRILWLGQNSFRILECLCAEIGRASCRERVYVLV